jgi:2-dehydropantoate 2-reductase
MNILVFGAGAIGSLFAAFLSKKNKVTIIGRSTHIDAVQKQGLRITGKTKIKVTLPAYTSIQEITDIPDTIILTVKSYDTEEALNQIVKIRNESTVLVSLQNGLDNIKKIGRRIAHKNIIAGVTTQGALFVKPGHVQHTGYGNTILGDIFEKSSERIDTMVKIFNNAGVATKKSRDIHKDLWAKAIINSSINPLTAFFSSPNGYLLRNPLLERMIELICAESTAIANAHAIPLNGEDMIAQTKEVIQRTATNSSSMLQSIQKGKKTEIDAINGVLIKIGKQHNVETQLNEIAVNLVTSLTEEKR